MVTPEGIVHEIDENNFRYARVNEYRFLAHMLHDAVRKRRELERESVGLESCVLLMKIQSSTGSIWILPCRPMPDGDGAVDMEVDNDSDSL